MVESGEGRGSEHNLRQVASVGLRRATHRGPTLLVGSGGPGLLTRLGQMWIEHAQPHAHHDGREARVTETPLYDPQGARARA